ncbi:YndM family protein [Virgibacillus sp. CBA3643]|uniref:YndM family protein n=1 Tax=Virgibacillus sp. CBA3643 TaxID=2942278 RepID=UPI0035A2B5C4
MNHIKLFAVKFIGTLIMLYLILGLGYGMTFGNVFLITLVLGMIAYLGDVIVLPNLNNTVATIADFATAFLIIYFMSFGITTGGEWFTASFVAAVGVTLFEYFYHKYYKSAYNEAHQDEREGMPRDTTMQTEASEETSPYDPENKNE